MKSTWLFLLISVFALTYQCLGIILDSTNSTYLTFEKPESRHLDLIEAIQDTGQVFSKHEIRGWCISFKGKNRLYTITDRPLGQGGHAIVLLGFIVDTKSFIEHAVAVKVEAIKRQLLPFEFKFYEKLLAVERGEVRESQECVLKAYHLEENLEVQGIRVNAMFMQLLGKDILDYTDDADKLTAKEIDVMGISLMDCLDFIHTKGVRLNDIKSENTLTGFGPTNFHFFLADFGAATCHGIKDTYDHTTLPICSSRALKGVKGKLFPPAEVADDFFSVLVTLAELAGADTSSWDQRGHHTLEELAHFTLKARENLPVEEVCKADETGTLAKFWDLIKDESTASRVPIKQIKALFEDNLKNYLRDTIDFDWHLNIQPRRESRIVVPFIRLMSNENEAKMPAHLKNLYQGVMSADTIKIAGKYHVLKQLINWGSSSLIFLGKKIRSSKYFAVKIQQQPIFGGDTLRNQYDMHVKISNTSNHYIASYPKYVPDAIDFRKFDLLIPKQQQTNENTTHEWVTVQVFVMELLGPSLETLMESYSFPLRTIITVSIHVLEALQVLQDRHNIVMNQVTPDHILTEYNGSGIRLIGLSHASEKGKPIQINLDSNSMAHAPNNILQLVAANNKKPVVPHPFSDYESYFYTLLRFIHKKLPWDTVVSQNLSDSEKAKQILKQRSVKLISKLLESDKSDVLRNYNDLLQKQRVDVLKDVFVKSFFKIREYIYDKVYAWSHKSKILPGFVKLTI